MSTSIITSKGQTTIPLAIRNYLNLDAGDRLEYIPQGDGKVMIMPATLDVADLEGILPKPGRRVTVEEMQKAIEEGGSAKP